MKKGLESSDNNQEWDSKLFIFSLIISSIFIYNTKNTLTKDAFNKLAVMDTISKKIKLGSKMSASQNETYLRNSSPDFIWLVRDFTLEQTKSADEKLAEFLDDESGNNSEAKKRNEIRSSFRNSFKSHFNMKCSLNSKKTCTIKI